MSEPILCVLDWAVLAMLYLIFSGIVAVAFEYWFAAIAVPDPEEMEIHDET